MSDLTPLEQACLSGLVDTGYGHKYQPKVAAVAVGEIMAAERDALLAKFEALAERMETMADGYERTAEARTGWPDATAWGVRSQATSDSATDLRNLIAEART